MIEGKICDDEVPRCGSLRVSTNLCEAKRYIPEIQYIKRYFTLSHVSYRRDDTGIKYNIKPGGSLAEAV